MESGKSKRPGGRAADILRYVLLAPYGIDFFFLSAITFMAISRTLSTPTTGNLFHNGIYFGALLLGFLLNLRFFAYLLCTAVVFESYTALIMLVIPREENLWRGFLTFHTLVGWEIFLPFFFAYLFRHWRLKGGTWSWNVLHGHLTYFFLRISIWAGIISGPFPMAPGWIGRLHAWILLIGLPLVAFHVLSAVSSKPFLLEKAVVKKVTGWSLTLGGLIFLGLFFFLLRFEKHKGLYGSPSIAQANPEPVKRNVSFLPSPVRTKAGAIYRPEVLGNSKESCGKYGCHQFIYKEWLESPHRHSTNFFYQKALTLAVRKHGKKVARLCAGCHDPVSLISGKLHRGVHLSAEGKQEGISCMVCHSMKPHKGEVSNGSYTFILPERFFTYVQTVFTSHNLKEEHLKDFMNTKTLKNPAYCGACHRVVLPVTRGVRDKPVVLQDTYTSWKNGPYLNKNHPKFKEKKTCQGCHMPRTTYQERPPELSRKSPNHRFAVSNSALPYLYGHKKQLEEVETFLQNDVLKVKIAQVEKNGKQVQVTLLVENKGTGHAFPAGPLDINEVWLELKVLDGSGETVYWSGSIGQDQKVDPGARFFKIKELTGKGKEIVHHDILSVGYTEEERILPPLGKITEKYIFNLPADKQKLTIRARVLYRKFNQDFVDWVFSQKQKKVTLPAVEVAKTEKDVFW